MSLVSISVQGTPEQPATDLGFVLVKHPDRIREVELPFGKAFVFFPAAGIEKTTVCLLLDVDTVKLVRKGRVQTIFDYVNDRAYTASSFLTVALSKVFNSAIAGTCKDKPELVDRVFDMTVKIPVIASKGGEDSFRELFEPVGYTVSCERLTLDEKFPEWGQSNYYRLTLTGKQRIRDVLEHLYVMIPVLDNLKHYFVGEDEIEKLVRHGGAWLDKHPKKVMILARYLEYKRHLVREAEVQVEAAAPPTEDDSAPLVEEETEKKESEVEVEKRLSLQELRTKAILQSLTEEAVTTVIDLGCGDGKVLAALARGKVFMKVAGLDVSLRCLRIAKDRVKRTGYPMDQVTLIHGALTYRDRRIEGFDGCVLAEVVEHLDPHKVEALERVVFGEARPRVVIVTTPNREYNTLFPFHLPNGLRHKDHRFEWTRAEFEAWLSRVAKTYRYSFIVLGVGDPDPEKGSPTLMARFVREKE
jgi:3' terminal RNA ribose 2'-O-methyltransferase Hen1